MFHLLVAYRGWLDGGGSISPSRIYINPDEAPGSAFLTGDKLDIAKVSKAPALLKIQNRRQVLQSYISPKKN